jgi:hypothetical protein
MDVVALDNNPRKDCIADSDYLFFLNPFWHLFVNTPFLPIKAINQLYISFYKIFKNTGSRDIGL